jgi:hypothetical protein
MLRGRARTVRHGLPQSKPGLVLPSSRELLFRHADECDDQGQARCLLGGTFARGGDPALGLTGQLHLDIVYFPERARTRRVPCSENGSFELLALSAPMPGVRHYGIATVFPVSTLETN